MALVQKLKEDNFFDIKFWKSEADSSIPLERIMSRQKSLLQIQRSRF